MSGNLATVGQKATTPTAGASIATAGVVGAATGQSVGTADTLDARLHAFLKIVGGVGVMSPDQLETVAPATPETAAPTATSAAASVQAAKARVYPAAEGDKAQFQTYARSHLSDYGWSEAEMDFLIDLWNRESGWNPNAQNPTSTAFGIAQFLDTTWKGTGITKTNDPYRQIDAGLAYVKGRYGSPSAAIEFWNKHHWY